MPEFEPGPETEAKSIGRSTLDRANAVIVSGLKLLTRAGIRVAAVVGAYLLVSGDGVSLASISQAIGSFWVYAACFALLGVLLDLAFRTDKALWRYVSIVDVAPIIRTSIISTLLFLAATFFLERGNALPRTTLLFLPILDIAMTLSLILLRRMVHDKETLKAIAPFLTSHDNRTPLILVGSMDRADTFLRELAHSGVDYRPAGIVTDVRSAALRELRGVKVLSGAQAAFDILDDFTDHGIEAAIVFLDGVVTPGGFGVERLGQLRTRGVQLLRVPSMVELAGEANEPVMRKFELEELLARPARASRRRTAAGPGRRSACVGHWCRGFDRFGNLPPGRRPGLWSPGAARPFGIRPVQDRPRDRTPLADPVAS